MTTFVYSAVYAIVLVAHVSAAPTAPGGRSCTSTNSNNHCYVDYVDGKSRLLTQGPFSVGSKGECATICDRLGLPISGVEDGNQCFCDRQLNQPQKEVPLSECKDMGGAIAIGVSVQMQGKDSCLSGLCYGQGKTFGFRHEPVLTKGSTH